ncbi:MAG: hypothetical protein E7277_00350 [Lachnospiraceae bacterium]|nr:hypothetical protein [Lachnospiraceae bacterium]
MSGAELGFIIWAVVGLVIIGIGIKAIFSKKAVGFWANVRAVYTEEAHRNQGIAGNLLNRVVQGDGLCGFAGRSEGGTEVALRKRGRR